jgi:phage gpG-like protein
VREFTLESMAAFLTEMAIVMPAGEHAALTQAAALVEAEAKGEIGNYQGAAGPFAAWAPLQPATIDRKANGDTPLLETGEMRDSIGTIVDGHDAYVGSNNDKAVWQELGTSRGIPPRSFLGGAAVRKSPEVRDIIGATVVATLIKGETPHVNGEAVSIQIP